jgi:DNA polymerase-3 subunit epsilon
MFVIAYDTETTGLPNWKEPSGDPSQPHLVQIAALVANIETRKVVASIDLIIKPDGWEIPVETSEIHGITTEFALEHGVPEAEAYAIFMSLWGGKLRVAHNRTFDQRIIRIATKRYGTSEQEDAWGDKETHACTMLLSRASVGLKKAPKLAEAYLHYTGKDLENAHSALADATACLDVYFALLDERAAA